MCIQYTKRCVLLYQPQSADYISHRLRYAELAAKEAGVKKRVREKGDAKTQSEREGMALADEARRVVIFLRWTPQTYRVETATNDQQTTAVYSCMLLVYDDVGKHSSST